MVTVHADPHVASSEYLAQERRLQECVRSLQAHGWEQRLQSLATHMVERRLVRGRGDAGAPLRHLDLDVLREALSRADDDGYLIFQLVVEGLDPALVARERGVSRPALVEMLRDAVDQLAIAYEDTAYASVAESKQEQVRATLARKRG
jgi:hypothetical protein